MTGIKINEYNFTGPYYFDRNFSETFACVYAIVENSSLIYIGITHDINERIAGHHKEACWRRNANSTNTLYILKEDGEIARKRIEQEVRDRFTTPCNEI